MTLSAWVTVGTSTGIVFGRYSNFASTGGGFMIELISGKKLRFTLTNTGGGTTGTATSSGLSTSTLYHVVGVWDGSSAMTLYINGSSDGTGTFTTTPGNITGASLLAGANYLSTGSSPGNIGNFYNNTIDACRLYNTNLTSGQVTEIYGSGRGLAAAGGASANLVGWWKFDEGSGSTANDSSSGAHNGTLTNGPTYGSAGVRG